MTRLLGLGPKALNATLARYLDHYRQVLLQSVSRGTEKPGSLQACAFLWISFGGTPMTETAIYGQIVRRTKVEFGHPLSRMNRNQEGFNVRRP